MVFVSDRANEGWEKRDSTEPLFRVIHEPRIHRFPSHKGQPLLLVFSGRVDGSGQETALCLTREGELFSLAWRVLTLYFQAIYQRATHGLLGELRRKSSIRLTQRYIRQLLECSKLDP